jgi:hypothetical protein
MIAAITDQRIGLGDAIGAATAQRKPIQVPDILQEPTSPVNEIIVREGYRGILAIPLLPRPNRGRARGPSQDTGRVRKIHH